MIAVDTNVLTYAHRVESEWHGEAAARLVALGEGVERWALPVFCITEFMRERHFYRALIRKADERFDRHLARLADGGEGGS